MKRPDLKLLGVFDTEATGVDVENDRIVTAFIGLMNDDGELVEKQSWILNPGIPIPEGAAAVHGITTERAIAEGRTDLKKAIHEIVTRLDVYDRRGIPIAIYNAPFDLTLLDRESRRHINLKTFRPPRVVIDPLVLDKGIDKFRKGSRKLVAAAEAYGVPVRPDAHDAEADCVMTGQVALKILTERRPWTAASLVGRRQPPPENPIPGLSLEAIHNKTIPTKRDQARGFRAYLHKQADAIADPIEAAAKHEEAKGVKDDWPWTPFPEESETA